MRQLSLFDTSDEPEEAKVDSARREHGRPTLGEAPAAGSPPGLSEADGSSRLRAATDGGYAQSRVASSAAGDRPFAQAIMRPSGRKSLLDGADFIATQTLVQGSTSDRLSESERSHSETSPGTLPASILAATPSPDVRSLAQSLAHALENALYLGTSSWSFPGWSGLIYGQPSGKSNLSQQGLPAYAQHPLLRSVGVDSGFYAPLDSARLARWAAQVPPGFRFLVKAPALITDRFRRAAHGRPAGTNPSFLDAEHALDIAVGPFLEGLGDKAGVLLFQFPPVGRDGSTEPRRFAEALYRFLKRLPKGPTYAVELRDRPLLTPDLAAALHHGGAVPSLALHPRLPPLPTQLSLFDAYRADGPLVVRWLLRRNRRYAEARERYAPFDRLCEPDPIARHDLADAVIAALGERRPVFVIANNKAEGSAPLTLIELARQLADVRNHSA